MIERNEATFEIDGITRGFKFGTYTFVLINKLSGTKTTDEVFKGIESGDMDSMSTFYYACAIHWHKNKKKEIDFEEVHVMDWLDEIGFEKAREITDDLIKTFQIKNLPAPETGQLQPSMNGKH